MPSLGCKTWMTYVRGANTGRGSHRVKPLSSFGRCHESCHETKDKLYSRFGVDIGLRTVDIGAGRTEPAESNTSAGRCRSSTDRMVASAEAAACTAAPTEFRPAADGAGTTSRSDGGPIEPAKADRPDCRCPYRDGWQQVAPRPISDGYRPPLVDASVRTASPHCPPYTGGEPLVSRSSLQALWENSSDEILNRRRRILILSRNLPMANLPRPCAPFFYSGTAKIERSSERRERQPIASVER